MMFDAGITAGTAVSQAEVIRMQDSDAALLFDQEQVLVVTSDQDALIDRAAVPSILDALASIRSPVWR